MTLYQNLANRLREHIQHGFYKVGDKLPSVRQLAQEHSVSISTVQEAYRQLEQEILVEARPKSGYFVCHRQQSDNLPSVSRPPQRPLEVSQWEAVLNMLMIRTRKDTDVHLQHAMPDMKASTLKPLLKTLSDLSKQHPELGLGYGDVRGAEELRIELSRLAVASGCQLHPDDLVITSGCQEALSVCLRAVSEPGDIIAIESPSFYGSMQAIKAANLKVMEIPTHPETGMSLEALELALDQWPIKAIFVTPTCNNPMGYTMPDDKKEKLYRLAQNYNIAIVEDDIYGDISYQFPRPKSIKSFDTDGRVLLCSSFSKTIAPGMRVGWIAPGRYRDKVTHIKYVNSSMCPVFPQLAIAKFIRLGGYAKHLRLVRQRYERQRDHLLNSIKTHLPSDTRVSFPDGSFILWVELNENIDATKMLEACREKGVGFAPGPLFSSTGKFRNCLRLNYSELSMEKREWAIKTLAKVLKEFTQENITTAPKDSLRR
ncbi:PLP-dependent aminotransferase family protein [Marinomonas transparens]|uniref:PLP-dependent aminotransferase family protein n=1 Tax=Marinomonas transparens TaxID=2795388 RepID=A0A934MZD1_9GAMM|nr:PLP-dependent aminotransferase family protein [Marinomonas transparens]MBJ7537415.1 PLP-dependent aminotransferase family protein [Marinomonas transparens]